MAKLRLIENIHFLMLALLTSTSNQTSYAQSFLFPGAQTSFESGLSQTNTHGAVAVATNPANTIITKRVEAYGDLSLLSVSYTYLRPTYAPAVISLMAPPVNIGASFKPKTNFAIGIFITPRPSFSSRKIKSVPYTIGGEVLLVDVDQKSSTFVTAIGAGIKVDKNTSIGFSILETAEDSQVIVRQEGTTDDKSALAGMRYKGSSAQFVLGCRSVLNKQITLAGSLKTPGSRSYRGTEIVKGDEDTEIHKKSFDPMVVAVGGEYRFGAPAAFSEIRYERWAAGQSSYSSGMPGSTSKAALNDVLVLVTGGRLKVAGGHSGSASIGIYPHNIGLGSTSAELESGIGKSGVQFGNFDALDRMMIAASYRKIAKKIDFTAGFNYMFGSRTVPAAYPNAGQYSMSVLTVGAGGSFYF